MTLESTINLVYVLLAHENAEQVADHVILLLSADPTGYVVIHYDRNAPKQEFASLTAALADSPRAYLVSDRVHCDWGRFGLVDGVVRALRIIRQHDLACDYIYLLSSSCAPIKPLAKLKRFLLKFRGMEFIEAHSADWITSGLREERYSLFHWFSFRTHRKLFDFSVDIQRALRIKRRIPAGLSPRFGSQWWCLTRQTCFAILDFIDRRPSDYRFFRTTWISDEIFFQTMAASLADESLIAGKNLTYFKFTPKGRPISFYNDHADLIQDLPFFFARKVSLAAAKLRQRLAAVAGELDDGGDLPSLDPAKAGFQYDHHLSRNIDFARPGQIFYGGQGFTGWPSALGSYSGIFGVLHGPPCITRMVGERLKAVADITLLGRVFHPDMVDLGPAGNRFEGFTADDTKIRDLDRPLYLSRLLARCTGFPILEMAPGDDNHGEWYFQQSKSAIFLPCIPANVEDEDWLRLYWLLAAAGFPRASIRPYEMRDVGNLNLVRTFIDGYIDRAFHGPHRKWVNDALLSSGRSDRLLPVRWGRGRRMRPGSAGKLTARLIREFGPAMAQLLDGVCEIESEFRGVPAPNLLDSFPAAWARLFEQFTMAPTSESGGESAASSQLAPRISVLRSTEKGSQGKSR